MSLNERIIKSRQAVGLTQDQLATLCGLTQQALQAIEVGKIKQPRRIEKIAKALNVTPEWLLFGSTKSFMQSCDQIPLFLFKDISAFIREKSSVAPIDKIYIALKGGSLKSFAFKIEKDYSSFFIKDDIVVIDPTKKPNHLDYVLIIKDDVPILGKYFEVDGNCLLTPIDAHLHTITDLPKCVFAGVATQRLTIQDL